MSDFQLTFVNEFKHLMEILTIKNINISNSIRINDSLYNVPRSVETNRRIQNEYFEESVAEVDGC